MQSSTVHAPSGFPKSVGLRAQSSSWSIDIVRKFGMTGNRARPRTTSSARRSIAAASCLGTRARGMVTAGPRGRLPETRQVRGRSRCKWELSRPRRRGDANRPKAASTPAAFLGRLAAPGADIRAGGHGRASRSAPLLLRPCVGLRFAFALRLRSRSANDASTPALTGPVVIRLYSGAIGKTLDAASRASSSAGMISFRPIGTARSRPFEMSRQTVVSLDRQRWANSWMVWPCRSSAVRRVVIWLCPFCSLA